MPDYDPNKESSCIVYLDAHNLYGGAMSDALPYADFKLNGGMELEDLLKITDNDNGAIIR